MTARHGDRCYENVICTYFLVCQRLSNDEVVVVRNTTVQGTRTGASFKIGDFVKEKLGRLPQNNSCKFGNAANLERSSHVLIVQFLRTKDPNKNTRKYRKRNQTSWPLLACLPQAHFALTAGHETDKAERGGLETPLEKGARTKRFDREIRGSRIPYSCRDEQTLSSHVRTPFNVLISTMAPPLTALRGPPTNLRSAVLGANRHFSANVSFDAKGQLKTFD